MIQSPQLWPISPDAITELLPVTRLVELARHFRVQVERTSTWSTVRFALLAQRGVDAVPLLHLLRRRELSDLCRVMGFGDYGPTQLVLAQLLPLCRPSAQT